MWGNGKVAILATGQEGTHREQSPIQARGGGGLSWQRFSLVWFIFNFFCSLKRITAETKENCQIQNGCLYASLSPPVSKPGWAEAD